MTIYDFFFTQTLQEIKQCFKNVGLQKYTAVPENVNDFCKVFGLLPDERVSYLHTTKRFSRCELCLCISVENPIFPETAIKFEPEYTITSSKGACSIKQTRTFGFHEHCCFFKQVSDIFDNRPEYNNIEFSVSASDFPNLFSKNGYNEHHLDKSKTLKDAFDAIVDYEKRIKPYIDVFVESTTNDEYEKVWNKYLPTEPWKRGNEIFRSYPLLHTELWMLLNEAGYSISFEDFIVLCVATCKNVLGENTRDLLSEDTELRIKSCLEAIKKYKTDFVEDTSYVDWCNLYKKANEEYYNKIQELCLEISKKYGINSKYIRNSKGFGFTAEFKGNTVPEDAYINS